MLTTINDHYVSHDKLLSWENSSKIKKKKYLATIGFHIFLWGMHMFLIKQTFSNSTADNKKKYIDV